MTATAAAAASGSYTFLLLHCCCIAAAAALLLLSDILSFASTLFLLLPMLWRLQLVLVLHSLLLPGLPLLTVSCHSHQKPTPEDNHRCNLKLEIYRPTHRCAAVFDGTAYGLEPQSPSRDVTALNESRAVPLFCIGILSLGRWSLRGSLLVATRRLPVSSGEVPDSPSQFSGSYLEDHGT